MTFDVLPQYCYRARQPTNIFIYLVGRGPTLKGLLGEPPQLSAETRLRRSGRMGDIIPQYHARMLFIICDLFRN